MQGSVRRLPVVRNAENRNMFPAEAVVKMKNLAHLRTLETRRHDRVGSRLHEGLFAFADYGA